MRIHGALSPSTALQAGVNLPPPRVRGVLTTPALQAVWQAVGSELMNMKSQRVGSCFHRTESPKHVVMHFLPSRICSFVARLAILTACWSCSLQASAVGNASLSEIAASKRGAVLQLTAGKAKDAVVSFGVFVSKDGLALVDVQALVGRERPEVRVGDGRSIPFGRTLGIYPEQELALMKFDHAPTLSVVVARAEPAVNDPIALVTLNRNNPWDAGIPSVCGPVMVKRSELTPNSKVLRFTRVLSLGAGLSDAQRTALGPGRFAINQDGQLVAFMHGIRPGDRQMLVTLAPIVDPGERIDALAQEGKDIGFPIPDASNPIDPVATDPEFHPMNLAYLRQDFPETRRLLERLGGRYPESFLLQCRLADVGGVGSSLDASEPGRGVTVEQQVSMWQIRAAWLANNQRLQESVKARQAAIAFSPKDFGADRFLLADLLMYLERRDEAERVLDESHPFFTDDIRFLHKLNLLKLRQGKFEESDTLEKRISELEAIYTKE